MVLRGALALALALPAAGGTIEGRVDVRLPAALAEPRPAITALGEPDTPAAVDRRRSVVFLETAPRGAFEEAARDAHATLDQRGEAFSPYVLPIQVGTTVDFPNHDPLYHNVFSLSKPKRFDLGRYGKGGSRSVRFDRPGVVRVFCDIHSHMSAFILVFSHRFFAASDASGRYRIEGVPAGDYEIVAWTDGRERARRAVHVPEGGAVQADFEVR